MGEAAARGYAESGKTGRRSMAHAQSATATEDARRCIAHCLDCYSVCSRTKAHGLRLGGRHAEERHQKLLDDCIEICRTAADFMLRGSDRIASACRACAEVCSDCARSCRGFAGDRQLDECAKTCDSCAQLCRKIAGD